VFGHNNPLPAAPTNLAKQSPMSTRSISLISEKHSSFSTLNMTPLESATLAPPQDEVDGLGILTIDEQVRSPSLLPHSLHSRSSTMSSSSRGQRPITGDTLSSQSNLSLSRYSSHCRPSSAHTSRPLSSQSRTPSYTNPYLFTPSRPPPIWEDSAYKAVHPPAYSYRHMSPPSKRGSATIRIVSPSPALLSQQRLYHQLSR